ncbi:DUF2975 domain-containing protein [Spirosoma rigui]|uniref:DUF2975 domain-containing protein n=1 Tax=Spirosoma rigui TaxID=564064 RepID=UPI0009B0A7FE|nr:DUF2975 domain-containing protein [Spirosoma rigui]
MRWSLSRKLTFLADALFYITLVMIVGIMAVFVLGAAYYPALVHFSINLPVNLEGLTKEVPLGEALRLTNGPESSISIAITDRGVLMDHMGLCLKIGFVTLFGTGLALTMLWNIRQIMRTVSTPQVFSSENLWRVRKVAFLIIALGLLRPLMLLLIRSDVTALFETHQIRYSQFYLNPGLFEGVLIGFFMLGLVEVFRSGLQLRQEQDLTI